MTLDEFFAGQEQSRKIFEAVHLAVEAIGPVELRITKSQVAFRHNKNVAVVWIPGKYLHRKAAPLVLTILLRRRDTSPRWKEIVEPTPGRFTHHLELYAVADIDDEVISRLEEAWAAAGTG